MSGNKLFTHWKQNPNFEYTMKNRDGSMVSCKIVYMFIHTNYDMSKKYDPARVLIEIGKSDFREIPYVYINI